MLKRILATVGLAVSLTLNIHAADAGVRAIQLDSMLRVYEEHDVLASASLWVEGDTHGAYFPKLVVAAARRGVTVVFVTEDELFGFYDEDDHIIYLNPHQSMNGLLTTLFHELGHALGPKELKGTTNGQVFAEALAALSNSQLKLNTYKPSFLYLQQFPQRHEVILKYTKQLEQLSDELVAELR